MFFRGSRIFDERDEQRHALRPFVRDAAAGFGGIQLNWICGFSIPLITICAFFVLNIFLTLLNIVFFWLPFIKICIPFPLPTAANSGDSDGT